VQTLLYSPVFTFIIQGDSGGKISILRSDSTGHCEKKIVRVKICLILNGTGLF